MKLRIERIKQEKIPFKDETLLSADPDLKEPLTKLKELPEDMQDNIFAYMLKKRNEGLPKEKSFALLRYLLDKSYQMLDFPIEQSDKEHTPKSVLEPELIEEAERIVTSRIKVREIDEAFTRIQEEEDRIRRSIH